MYKTSKTSKTSKTYKKYYIQILFIYLYILLTIYITCLFAKKMLKKYITRFA